MTELSIRELQSGLLDIMKDIHSFCVNNGIKYSLTYGTLLGAVRHKGFIPWDDDVDIVMLRKDYETFVSTYVSDKYNLAHHKKGKNDCFIAYSRVFDTRTSAATGADWSSFNTGFWVDVFPLDNIPGSIEEYRSFYYSVVDGWHRVNRMRCRFARLSWTPANARFRLIAKKICLLNGVFGGTVLDKFISEHTKYNDVKTGFVSQLAAPDVGPVEYLPASIMDNLILMQFEDASFYGFAEYDSVLRLIYGNYMELPPENKRVPHMSTIKFFRK